MIFIGVKNSREKKNNQSAYARAVTGTWMAVATKFVQMLVYA